MSKAKVWESTLCRAWTFRRQMYHPAIDYITSIPGLRNSNIKLAIYDILGNTATNGTMTYLLLTVSCFLLLSIVASCTKVWIRTKQRTTVGQWYRVSTTPKVIIPLPYSQSLFLVILWTHKWHFRCYPFDRHVHKEQATLTCEWSHRDSHCSQDRIRSWF